MPKKGEKIVQRVPLPPGGKLKIKSGKGVMSKDGRTPYAAGTMHYTRETERGLMKSPCNFTHENLASLLHGLFIGQVEAIEVIDTDNVQTTYTLE